MPDERLFEYIQVVDGAGYDNPTLGDVFQIGPSSEDQKSWVWRNNKTFAGPFEDKDTACRWLRQVLDYLSTTSFQRTPVLESK